MSYDYRMVYTKLWRSDQWFGKLDTAGKLFWLWLVTNDSANASGVYQLRPEMAAVETGLAVAQIDGLLARFEADKKIMRDGDVVWIRKMREYQTRGSASPKITSMVRASLRAVSDVPLKIAYAEAYGENLDDLLQNPSNKALLTSPPPAQALEQRPDRQRVGAQDPYQTTLTYLAAKAGVNGKSFNPIAAIAYLFTARFGDTYKPDYARLGKLATALGNDYVALAKLIWTSAVPEGDPHNYLVGCAKRLPMYHKSPADAPAPVKETDDAEEFWQKYKEGSNGAGQG